ncbi:caspase, EACC1-associated type [Streptomyces sp. NPDC002817]|uniref:caspase family protein n=1 Tax=Streptomyces sp. NPDC088357 TaxID=3154655 RepID=UPI00341C1CF3
MAQPDPSASRAVIVGVRDYAHLDPLPAVANNVARLAELLRDPGLWGLAEEHCRVLLDPVSERDVLDAVHKAASEAKEAFLLYFAGHGLPDQPDALQLALPDTSREHLYRALSYDRVRSVILTACKATHKVVILDTCFSGRALKGFMGPSGVADFAEVDGTFLMTSSAENRTSMAPVGARYTLFTGELVRVLEQGDPRAGDLLDMDTIYRAVDRALRATGGPVPQQRARNAGARITFVRNRAHAGPLGRPVSASPAMGLPDGYEGLLHETVPGLVEQLDVLARRPPAGTDVDTVLCAVVARWPEQQTAALLIELDHVGMGRETTVACHAVAGRLAQEAAACLHVLDQLGAAQVIDTVFGALLHRGPVTVAQVAGRLREQGPWMTRRLVRVALLESGPERSADLVTTLHRHGLGDEALTILREVIALRPLSMYVGVADALLADGAHHAAYELYAALPGALAASRPAEETAWLLRSMAENGARKPAMALLGALLGVSGDAGPVDWALALRIASLDWADESARDLLGTASADHVLRIMEKIRRTRPTGLLTVVRWAIGDGRSAADILAFSTALRRYGLPLDALSVLTEAADADLENAAFLIHALHLRRGDEAARLVERALERPVVDRIALVAALRGHGARGEAARILDDLLSNPAEDLLARLPLIAGEVDVDTLYAHIASSARSEHLVPLLVEYWGSGRQADAERLLALLAGHEQSRLEETLLELMRVGRRRPPAGRPEHAVTEPRSWFIATVPRLDLPVLVRVTTCVLQPDLPVFRAAVLRSHLAGAVAEGLVLVPVSALLVLIVALRDSRPGPPGPKEQDPLLWVLGTALAKHEDAAQLLSQLFEDARHAPHIADELCALMRSVDSSRIVEVHRVLVRSGRSADPSVLSGLRHRPDLLAVLEALRASGLSRGDAMRIRRAAAKPDAWSGGVAVDGVLEQAAGLFRASALTDAARTLEPHELGELLIALVARQRAYDAEWVVSAAVRRRPLNGWLPDVLAVLCGARMDDMAARVVQKAVRRSHVSDVAALADALRKEGMPDQALLLEEANSRNRNTRWLHR